MNLNELSPADLEALWNFAHRKYLSNQIYIDTSFNVVDSGHKTSEWFNGLPEHGEQDKLSEILKRISEVQLNQISKINPVNRPQ